MNKFVMCACMGIAVLPSFADDVVDYRSWLIANGVTPTISGSNYYLSQTYLKNAFDGRIEFANGNRYLSGPWTSGNPTLVFGGKVADKTFTMQSYRLCRITSDEWSGAERAPTAWTLEGADSSEGPWNFIERRTDVTTWGSVEDPWLEFYLAQPVSYPYYRLTLLESRAKSTDGCYFGLMEVEYRSGTSTVDGFLPANATYDIPSGVTKTFPSSALGRICRLAGAGSLVFSEPSQVTICSAEAFTGTVTMNGGTLVAPKSLEGRVTLNGGATVFYRTFDELSAQTLRFSVAGYAGSSTLEKFPVLVRLSKTAIPGFDPELAGSLVPFHVRAAAADNDTEYPCEVETWNSGGESLVWVQLPALARTGTTFRLLIGGGFSSFAAGATWRRTDADPDDGTTDTGNFAAVWHMATIENAVVPDATGNGLTAVPYATTTSKGYDQSLAVSGPVGTARQVSAVKEQKGPKLTVSGAAYNARKLGASFTASCWARLTDLPGGADGTGQTSYYSYPRLFSCKPSNESSYGWEIEAGSKLVPRQFSVATKGKDKLQSVVSEDVWSQHDDGWDYFTFVYNGTTLQAYTNGALLAEGTFSDSAYNQCYDQDFFIGGGKGEWSLAGEMDEARLFDGIESADWIAADYATQKRADFLSVESVESRGALLLSLDQAFSGFVLIRTKISGCADGTPRTVKLTAFDPTTGAVVTNVVQTFSDGLTQASVKIEGLSPATAYRVVAMTPDVAAGFAAVDVKTTSVKTYKMIRGDVSDGIVNNGVYNAVPNPSGNSSMSDEDLAYINTNTWQNINDETDTLERMTAETKDCEFVVDATQGADPTSNGVWNVRSSAESLNFTRAVTFLGKRLTIIGDRKADLTYQFGGGVSVRAHDWNVIFPELVLRNASAWVETSNAWAAYLYVTKLVIPEGCRGFVETWRTDPGDGTAKASDKSTLNRAANRTMNLMGSVEGGGTLVFCQAGDGNQQSRGISIRANLSLLTGKIEFNRSFSYKFGTGFRPPADCPVLTEGGILLDNRYHDVTNSYRSSKTTTLSFEVDATFATPNRGITVSSATGNSWLINVDSNKTVTLRNPLYGTGALAMHGSSAGTLRLEGAQGDWNNQFNLPNGTLVLAGAKPLGEGTLAVSGTGDVELDAAALKGGACYLKALSGSKQINVTNLPAEIGRGGVDLLVTPAADGVTRSQLLLPALPEGMVLRATVVDGVRTFSIGPKGGIVVIVR